MRQKNEENHFGRGIEAVNQGCVIFSNSLEQLYAHLAARLESTSRSFFAKKVIVMPSREMDKWFFQTLACDKGIAAGLTTLFFAPSINYLLHLFFGVTPTFLSKTELILNLFEEFKELPEKQALQHAQECAYLFQQYNMYGEEVLETWKATPSHPQHHMWNRCFPKPLFSWLKALPTPRHIPDFSLDLFAFSHLPPLYMRLLEKLNIPYTIYHLSPCQEFWSDLSYDDYELSNQLVSLGKIGRDFARQTELLELATEELYIEPPLSLQQEMLHLETRRSDGSVKVYQAASRHHEIELIFEQLADQEPRDIIVMAPDISLYEPYIHAVFGGKVPYQILDLSIQHHNPHMAGLHLLLSLKERRFSVTAVLELIHHPLIRLPQEVKACVQKWAETTHISWGFDAQHKGEVLGKDEMSSVGTWMGGISQLIYELGNCETAARISYTEAGYLGVFASWLSMIYTALQEADAPRTFADWSLLCIELEEKNFYFSDERASFQHALSPLNHDAKISLTTFFELVDTSETVSYNTRELQAVRFCSLLPMRAIPAKTIWIVGMDHDAFPRAEKHHSLDLLQAGPSRKDFDRALFLEALLSVRKQFVMSYLEMPSSMVAELMERISEEHIYTPKLHIPPKKDPIPFELKEIDYSLPDGEFTIDLQQLSAAIRSPIQHYYGLNFSEKRPLSDHEKLLLSPLERYLVLRESRRSSLEQAISKAKWEGAFPPGVYGELAVERLENERMNIGEESTYVFGFHQDKKEQIEELLWHMPPVTISLGEKTIVHIVGQVEGVSEEGFVVQSRHSIPAAIKALPSYLLVTGLPLLFVQEGIVKPPLEAPEMLLKELVRLYFLARTNFLFLMPEWIEGLLLAKPFDCALNRPEVVWAFRDHRLPTQEKIIERDRPLAEEIYGGVIDAWF